MKTLVILSEVSGSRMRNTYAVEVSLASYKTPDEVPEGDMYATARGQLPRYYQSTRPP